MSSHEEKTALGRSPGTVSSNSSSGTRGSGSGGALMAARKEAYPDELVQALSQLDKYRVMVSSGRAAFVFVSSEFILFSPSSLFHRSIARKWR